MPYRLPNQLAGMQMPVFLCDPQEVKLVQSAPHRDAPHDAAGAAVVFIRSLTAMRTA